MKYSIKTPVKIYLEKEDINKLIHKANDNGFNGKGCISHYIAKIAREQIIFLSEEVINILRLKNGKVNNRKQK